MRNRDNDSSGPFRSSTRKDFKADTRSFFPTAAAIGVVLAFLLSSFPGGFVHADTDPNKIILTRAERKLIDAERRGETASFVTGDPSIDDVARGSEWGADRTIRAEIIRTLVTAGRPDWTVRSKVISIIGARISGQINLAGAQLKFPLAIVNSFFFQPIILMDASARSISLAGSYVTNAPNAFDTKASNARVSIFAAGLRVGGDLLLNNHFKGKGEVLLSGAAVSGNADFSGSTIQNSRGDAVSASRMVVGGNCIFGNGFIAKGTVDLSESEVDHELICSGGTFESSSGSALNACYITVKGGVRLNQGFVATGGVCLTGANIEGNLDCRGGSFHAVKRPAPTPALDLHQAHIEKTLFLSQMVPDGLIDLSYAQARTLSDDTDSWPSIGYLELGGFTYDQIDSTSPIDASLRLSWLARQPRAHFSILPYRQLAKVFRDGGEDEAAKTILIGMEDARWKFGKLGPWDLCWNWVLWATIGYGYRPWRALLYIAIFVILGGILFRWGHNLGVVSSTDQDSYYRPFNSFVYSLETFLPLVDLGQAKHWRPDSEASTYGRMLRVYLWFHILFGWFFTSMLVVAITGLVRSS